MIIAPIMSRQELEEIVREAYEYAPQASVPQGVLRTMYAVLSRHGIGFTGCGDLEQATGQ